MRLVVELERRVEIDEVGGGAEEESGDTGGWGWSMEGRVEMERRWLVVEFERRVEIYEGGGGAGEESGDIGGWGGAGEESGDRLGWWWCCRGE
jgi:hypothetical protein